MGDKTTASSDGQREPGCHIEPPALLLAEMKALGVCPCGIYYFWRSCRHWVCAHAEFITFGRTEGMGRVPMQILLLLAQLKAMGVCPCRIYYFWQNRRHWVCAHAEFITFGTTEGIGRVPMRNLLLLAELGALGVCPCGVYYFWQY